jgi:glutathione peroxidase
MNNMTVYDFSATSIIGEEIPLSIYKGKVLLIVNTASKCGFTPQYGELQELYDSYKGLGLEILAFPCNQFASQEPGTNKEIANFCSVTYGVKFPVFSKIKVNGPDAHPLYKFLCEEAPGLMSNSIKWNFTKFLVDRDGNIRGRYAPNVKPMKLKNKIEELL